MQQPSPLITEPTLANAIIYRTESNNIQGQEHRANYQLASRVELNSTVDFYQW